MKHSCQRGAGWWRHPFVSVPVVWCAIWDCPFIAALGLIALVAWRRERWSRFALVDGLLIVGPATVIFAGLLARNVMLTGRLTGGPSSSRPLSLSEILEQTKWAIVELLGGDTSLVRPHRGVAVFDFRRRCGWVQIYGDAG